MKSFKPASSNRSAKTRVSSNRPREESTLRVSPNAKASQDLNSTLSSSARSEASENDSAVNSTTRPRSLAQNDCENVIRHSSSVRSSSHFESTDRTSSLLASINDPLTVYINREMTVLHIKRLVDRL